MSCLILTHLGEAVPLYLKDCVHQFRLFNADTPIYLILEDANRAAFFEEVAEQYSVTIVRTGELESLKTSDHASFLQAYKGDTAFRKGYWKQVRERFYFIEELMRLKSLEHVISMEYDVLVYICFKDLLSKLRSSHSTLRYVRDFPSKGHPAFLYIPTATHLQCFNNFFAQHTHMDDMFGLGLYARYAEVHALPVITQDVLLQKAIRQSQNGQSMKFLSQHLGFLAEDADHFQMLFDSLVVGQYIGGLDPRNTDGKKEAKYKNETALYSIDELDFQWKKGEKGFWYPTVCGDLPLACVHVHSKALHCFLSDRQDMPEDDYDVAQVHKSLFPN